MGKFSRYEFVQKIALGGMAEVWSAWAVTADGQMTDVVVKRILPQFANDEHFQSMLLEEAEVTAHLQHPNIVQVLDWGHLDETCFLAMERIVGLDGRQLIDACAMRNIRISPEIALYVIGEIFKGLDFAHKRTDSKGRPLAIVHRDVSPSNVLVSLEGDVKLADFGIAKAKTRASHTVAGQVRGKPRYMSPEQAAGGELDGRSDLFTAGIVLHEMLTGKPVFPPSNYLDEVVEVMKKGIPAPSKVNPAVPAEIDALVLALCERDVAKRPKTGAAAYEAIVAWAVKHKVKLGPAPVAELVTSIVRPAQEPKKSTAPMGSTRIMRLDDPSQPGVARFSTQGKMADPDLRPSSTAPAAKLGGMSGRSIPVRDESQPATRFMEMPISSDAVEPEPPADVSDDAPDAIEDDGPTDRHAARRPSGTVVGGVPPPGADQPSVATERRPPGKRGGIGNIAGVTAAVVAAIAFAVWWVYPRDTGTEEAEATPDLALDFEAAAAAVAANGGTATAEPGAVATAGDGTPPPRAYAGSIDMTPAPRPYAGASADAATSAPTPTPKPERTRTASAGATPVATKKPKATPVAVAEATPEVKGPGWLTLRSKPAGEVTIDGQWAGATPLTKHELMSGVHKVVVTSEDGRSASQDVTITAGETTPVSLTLQ